MGDRWVDWIVEKTFNKQAIHNKVVTVRQYYDIKISFLTLVVKKI